MAGSGPGREDRGEDAGGENEDDDSREEGSPRTPGLSRLPGDRERPRRPRIVMERAPNRAGELGRGAEARPRDPLRARV